MNSNRYSLIKSLVLAAALVACVSGVASADDSSMSRFGGDSYASFNRVPIDESSSAWRQANPQGQSERVLQAESASSASSAWQLDKPVFARATSAPSFKDTHPNGLTERELRALSSGAPAWHQNASQAIATTSNDRSNGVPQTFATPESRFFDSSK